MNDRKKTKKTGRLLGCAKSDPMVGTIDEGFDPKSCAEGHRNFR